MGEATGDGGGIAADAAAELALAADMAASCRGPPDMARWCAQEMSPCFLVAARLRAPKAQLATCTGVAARAVMGVSEGPDTPECAIGAAGGLAPAVTGAFQARLSFDSRRTAAD